MLAQQIEEERRGQEEIVKKQRQQMEEIKRKLDAETKRKEMQRKAQEHAQAQAQAQASYENDRRLKEDARVRELQQQLALSRKQFEELRLENEKLLEKMRDSLQQQIIDNEPDDDCQPALNNNQKKKTPSKSMRPQRHLATPSHRKRRIWRQLLTIQHCRSTPSMLQWICTVRGASTTSLMTPSRPQFRKSRQ